MGIPDFAFNNKKLVITEKRKSFQQSGHKS